MRAIVLLLTLFVSATLVHAETPAIHETADMLTIPGGQFIMGSSESETDAAKAQTMVTGSKRADDFAPREKPQHEVQIQSFKLAKYLVTRGDFARFVKATGYAGPGCYAYNGEKFAPSTTADWRNPGFPQTEKDPVVCVSYTDTLVYTKWISRKAGLPYRLPTEAELEYATRAGTTTSRFWGDDVALQCTYANGSDLTMKERFPKWYGAPCRDGYVLTSPVGKFAANQWNLSDMLGNVFELAGDCWHDTYDGAPTDGSAWVTGDCSKHAVRGGSFSPHPGSMRSASRTMMGTDDRTVFVGFRLAMSLPSR